MRQTAKHVLHAFGYYGHRLRAKPYPGVAVLAYHGVRADVRPAGSMCFENLHVTAATLASHCECLRALQCSVLSLADWEQIARGVRPLPPRAVLVTFDDGYRNVLTQGLPVLERYEIPALVFVCTSPVERQVRFWFDAVAARSGEEAVERAKALDYAAWRDVVASCEIAAGEDDPHAPLTVAELQELAAHPLVTIGGHTASHPILARAPVAVQCGEIAESCAALEAWINKPVTAFAYPNGRPGVDFTDETTGLLANLGITHAFSTRTGFADPAASVLEHPRFLMLDAVNGSELAHRLAITWPRPAVAHHQQTKEQACPAV